MTFPNGYKVFVKSDLYGWDNFSYETLEEALAGIGRLVKTIEARNDGVEREIGIIVNEVVEDEEDEDDEMD